MWPFKKKPPKPIDKRDWNEDWQVGDIAEVTPGPWMSTTEPWNRLKEGSRWTVIGFGEAIGATGNLYYILQIEGAPYPAYTTQTFRKVRTVSREESEVIKRVLSNKNTVEGPKRLIEGKNDE